MDTQSEPDQKQLTNNISSALVTIEELLTSILDISKLEAGVFVPNIQTVSLGAIFEQLACNIEPVSTGQACLMMRPSRHFGP